MPRHEDHAGICSNLGESEFGDALQHLQMVVYHITPGSKGHDEVSLAEEGICLRRKSEAPPAPELSVLVAVLQELNDSRN